MQRPESAASSCSGSSSSNDDEDAGEDHLSAPDVVPETSSKIPRCFEVQKNKEEYGVSMCPL